jgi:hypothetical protein
LIRASVELDSGKVVVMGTPILLRLQDLEETFHPVARVSHPTMPPLCILGRVDSFAVSGREKEGVVSPPMTHETLDISTQPKRPFGVRAGDWLDAIVTISTRKGRGAACGRLRAPSIRQK